MRRGLFVRAASLCAGWLLLSGARPDFLVLGVPVCLVLSYLGQRLGRAPGKTVGVPALLAYVPGFLWRSLMGGIDVAGRVFRPSMPLRPAFAIYRFREDDQRARVVFCDVLSLLPGSLVVGIEKERALIHILADDPRLRRTISHEEIRTRRLYRSISLREGSAAPVPGNPSAIERGPEGRTP